MASRIARRAQTALKASTLLAPSRALAIVKAASEDVMETGYGRKDGKMTKSEVRARVVKESNFIMHLEIGSGWEGSRASAEFAAIAEPAEDGRTAFQIGGLTSYKALQSKFLGLIPIGPAAIHHFGLYKRYLQAVEERLMQEDPQAEVTIGDPTGVT